MGSEPSQPWSHTDRSQELSGGAVRIDIGPPARMEPRNWTQRLRRWLNQGWASAGSPAPGVTALSDIRYEFVTCLDDVPTHQAAALAARILRARSLRELWHLRAELFMVISCHSDEAEAAQRLGRLDHYFPRRVTRSAFGPLDALPGGGTRR